MQNKLYSGIATLVGVTIGAGVLAVPHAIANAGFLTGIIGLITIGIAMMILNLCLGEVTLRTKGNHQLTGYAAKYLGATGKHLMGGAMIIGIYGALIAYIIGGGASLAQIFGGSQWLWSAIFFLTGIGIIHKGLKSIEESEFSIELAKQITFAIITILVFTSGKISTQNLQEFDALKLFMPYGIILFAYLGTTAIPEMREEMKNKLQKLKPAIIIGSILPIIVYLIFTTAVVGAAGKSTSEIATITIGQTLGTTGTILANLFATFGMMTAFIALGYGLKEMYHYDYKIKEKTSLLLTAIVPVALVFLGIHSFSTTLEITGAISGGATGVLAILMHMRAKKYGERKPEYKINITMLGNILLIIMFIAGAIYTIKGFF